MVIEKKAILQKCIGFIIRNGDDTYEYVTYVGMYL